MWMTIGGSKFSRGTTWPSTNRGTAASTTRRQHALPANFSPQLPRDWSEKRLKCLAAIRSRIRPRTDLLEESDANEIHSLRACIDEESFDEFKKTAYFVEVPLVVQIFDH